MLRKFASMPIISAQSGKTGETTTLRRSASRAVFDYEPRDGYIYVRSRAISSRCNDNYDEFPADEIKKGYKTFIGKPVFVNHHNDDHRRARGFIIDAALHEDTNPDGSPDTWAEVLMEVDAKRFPKLAKAVLAGEIDRTSMGVDVDHSICAACNNKATRPDEYCQHVPGQKGNRLYRHTASGRRVGILIREACYGLHFFENSLLVEDPADPTAFAWVDKPGKTASKTASGDVDKYLHITDNPHFSPDPNYAPANNTTLGGSMERGLCVSKKEDGVGGWARGYGYMRPYVAEIHVPKGTDTGEAGYGGERFIKAKDFDKAKVHRVIPIDEHVREHYRRPGWIESHLEKPHDDRKIVTKGLGYRDFEEKLPQDYHYSGPDVRDMPSSGHRKHYERWKRFMTTGGNSPYDFGENEFDDKRMSLSAAEPSEHDYDDEGQFIMRDKHGNETGRKWAKLHTALPGTSSEDYDRGRHKGRDAAACEQCGSDIYLVQDGSPGGSWQHDIDSGAGIPHKARPVIGNVPFGREGMLAEAAKSKKRSDMTPAELAADDRANRKARAWLNRNTPRINRVVDHWNQATEDEKAHGKSWYQDAHHMTRHIAESTGVDMHTAAGLMSVYSPQTHWAQNIMTAARVARTGEALGGKGSGVLATTSQKNAAERMLNGESYEKALGGPKTKAFAHLIEHGGNADPNDPKVVIDRHAASVACGARMTDRAYDQSKLGTKGMYAKYTTVYHKAAKQISKQEGQPIEPHQVQATTWLVRQRLNEEEDRALSKTAGSRSSSAAKRAIEQWSEYAGEHHPNLIGKIPGTGYSSSAPEDVQHASRMVDEHEPKEESVNKHQAFLRHMAELSHGSKRVAFGEVKAPMSVDTLRQTKCPVCGSDNSAFASGVCRVCGFVQPPAFLQDPDLDLAKQVDLRQDEAVDPGDLSMDGEVIQPPQGEPQPGQLDPDQLDEEGNPIEGDEDGDEQVDPSQIGEDGEIQGGVPGMPADGTPDLVCPGCGFTSDARPPQTTSLSGEYTDPGDDGTMEGDVCPNCQQAQLMSPQDQKDMQGPAA